MKILQSYKEAGDQQEKDWVYCGLDVCLTAEVYDVIYPMLNEDQLRVFRFEQAMQGPALAMQCRGILIDEDKRKEHLKRLVKFAEKRRADMDYAAVAIRGQGFKWGKGYAPSAQQLQYLLYTDLKLPVQRHYKTGKPTTDKKALEKLSKLSVEAKEVIQNVLDLRDTQKQVEVLSGGLSDDGRFRFTMAIGQTETGRASSYSDPYGFGDNIQNKDARLKDMFVPDPGWTMCNADLEQAESRVIAYVSGDEAYISAHEEGNVHVSSARVFWPDNHFVDRWGVRGWSGDDAENKYRLKHTPAPWVPQPDLADDDVPFYSYYDGSKRNQHGLNYGLTKYGLAVQAGLPQVDAGIFRARYFERYPNILRYHKYIGQCLRDTGVLRTPLGMQREFFNRPWEDHTIRQAIAFVPQSTVAQICWIGIYRVWKEHDPHAIQVLNNVHDSGLFQFCVEDGPEIIKNAMTVTFPIEDFMGLKTRECTIPVDVGTGKSWGECK